MACQVERVLLVCALTLIVWLTPPISGYHRLSVSKQRMDSGLRVNMFRREFNTNVSMTLADRIARAVERSKRRQLHIQSMISTKDAESRVHAGNGEFLMNVGVGTPAVSFAAIVDTGSDLTWTQCQPCVQCYKQPTPIFDPSKSSSYSDVPCDDRLCQALGGQMSCTPRCQYTYRYGDQSETTGVLSYETLTIGDSAEFGHMGLGCSNDNRGQGFQQGGGLVGLGRGPLSLVSQLGFKVQSKFSYCLLSITDSPSKTSPLFLGASAELGSGAKSVPFVQSSIVPTYYYLPIQGISVGGSLLDIPPGTFDIQIDGSGGFIIDSGTTVTILGDAAYTPMKKAFQCAINLPPADGSSVGLDLCYDLPSDHRIKVPSLAFHFKGGIDYELPADNYFVRIDTDNKALLCLAVLGSPGLTALGPSIFGNIQQQNFHILYDNAHNTLSFLPASCDSL